MSTIPLGDEKSYPYRTPPDKIQVFGEKPDTTFIQIKLVDYSGGWFSTKKGALKAVKEKASQLGGDAIILQGFGEKTEVGSIDPKTGLVSNYDVPFAKAVIIRFVP